MKIRITRTSEQAILPAYATPGSVAFDISSVDHVVIPPKEMRNVKTGLIIATPPGYVLLISARSSLFHKKGLMLANNIGIIDQDFCGPEDEIRLPLWNPGDVEVTVSIGERLVQGQFIKVDRAEWEEGPAVGPSRGGLGSTHGYQ